MAEITWLGTVSGDMDNSDNWDNGIPVAGDTAIIDSSLSQDDPSSGTCNAGTVNVNNGFPSGGTWNGNLTLTDGSWITAGTFNGNVSVGDTTAINGGTFTGAVTLVVGATITDGTFSGTIDNEGIISGGTFNGPLTQVGQIDGGTFNSTVSGATVGTGISGGTFNDAVIVTGDIYAATFNSSLNHNLGYFTGVTCNGDVVTDTPSYGSGNIFNGTLRISNANIYAIPDTNNYSGLKGLKWESSPYFTIEKGINGSSILGMI